MRRLLAMLGAFATAAALALVPHSAASASSHTPVIFVHGFSGKGSQWSSMQKNFINHGYPADRLHVFTYNWAQSNKTTAQELAVYVDGVRAQHGVDKVDIVTHSMGGLSSRWYIKHLGGAAHVDDWVSIGGPNNGTSIANLCSLALTSCREMQRGSSFINELNAGDPTPGDVTYTTFRSPCDLVIYPVSSTILDGATNHRTFCMEHIYMMYSPSVITNVRTTIS